MINDSDEDRGSSGVGWVVVASILKGNYTTDLPWSQAVKGVSQESCT